MAPGCETKTSVYKTARRLTAPLLKALNGSSFSSNAPQIGK